MKVKYKNKIQGVKIEDYIEYSQTDKIQFYISFYLNGGKYASLILYDTKEKPSFKINKITNYFSEERIMLDKQDIYEVSFQIKEFIQNEVM